MGAANFAQTAVNGCATLTAANTTRDGSGTPVPVTIVTGNTTAGTRIEAVVATIKGAHGAGVLRLFVNKGGTRRLLKELEYTAQTPGTTQAGTSVKWVPDPVFVLENGASLDSTTTDATSPMDVVAYGGAL